MCQNKTFFYLLTSIRQKSRLAPTCDHTAKVDDRHSPPLMDELQGQTQ